MRRETYWRVAAALGVATAAAAAVMLPSDDDQGRARAPAERSLRTVGGVAQVDPKTNAVAHIVRLGRPTTVAVGLGETWITANEHNRGYIVGLNGRSARRQRRIALGPVLAMIPQDLAVGAGAIWAVTASGVQRIDPENPRARRRVSGLHPGSLLSGIAVGSGAVWVTDATRGTLSRVDPAKARVMNVIPIGTSADAVAVDRQRVWVVDSHAGTIIVLSASRLRILRRISLPRAASISLGGGAAWVTASNTDALAHVAATSRRLTWVRVGRRPAGVCADRNDAWVANSEDGTVSRIDVHSLRVVSTVRVRGRPYRVACGEDAVWVTFLGPALPED